MTSTKQLPYTHTIVILIIAITLAVSTLLHAGELPLEKKVEEYLKAAASTYDFTGAAAVAHEGKILFAGGFGRADFEANRANTPNTRFLIGSVTKQFTAVAILQLQEQGKLSVYDTITKYFPDYPMNPDKPITIRHLLTHTSGIANYTAQQAFAAWLQSNPTLEEQIELIATLPPDFEPGAGYSYSNSGYKLMEAIIGKVSGKPWDQYVEENILKPAGMSASGYDILQVEESLRAIGYSSADSVRKRADMWPPGIAGAAGALHSTALDMIKWDDALRNGKVLQPASMEAMHTPFLEHYAYGWVIDSVGNSERIWHDGQIAGFSAMFLRLPAEKMAIAVLSNDDQGPVRIMGLALSAIAVGMPYDLPIKKTPVAATPEKYPDYVGAYDLGNGQYRFITTERGKLFSQRSGSPQFELQQEGDDKFFFPMEHATTVTFLRDDSGKVVAQLMHQTGLDIECKKLPDDEAAKVMPKYDIAQVDPKIYAEYVGEYQLAPGFILTVTTEGDQIFAQATGQPRFEIFPSSETKYFLKVVEAQVEFVRGGDGKVEKLILYQNGQAMPANKIK